ncbi:MAG: hypothetical protein V2B19_02410 [Pseudomonadota bacterium]
MDCRRRGHLVLPGDGAGRGRKRKRTFRRGIGHTSDKTPPAAVSIAYAPHGQFATTSSRIAPGRVDVTLTVSEPLSAVPFLTLTPTGGIPMAVELTRITDTRYDGYFTVLDTTPSGAERLRATAPFWEKTGAASR